MCANEVRTIATMGPIVEQAEDHHAHEREHEAGCRQREHHVVAEEGVPVGAAAHRDADRGADHERDREPDRQVSEGRGDVDPEVVAADHLHHLAEDLEWRGQDVRLGQRRDERPCSDEQDVARDPPEEEPLPAGPFRRGSLRFRVDPHRRCGRLHVLRRHLRRSPVRSGRRAVSRRPDHSAHVGVFRYRLTPARSAPRPGTRGSPRRDPSSPFPSSGRRCPSRPPPMPRPCTRCP